MSEWWTYSLSDFLLFSPRTYRRLFELYNAQVWPAHLVAVGLGLAILLRVLRARRAWPASGMAAGSVPASRDVSALFPDRASAALLAVCWGWVAWAFHLERYATINWAAAGFAAAFGIQALLLAMACLVPRATGASAPGLVAQRTGLALFSFALFVQPFLAPLLGRPWMQMEVFGIAPDPTVLATLGLLLFARGGRAALLWPIPLAWCAISGATLWAMGSPDALLMPLAGIAALSIRLADARSSMRTSA